MAKQESKINQAVLDNIINLILEQPKAKRQPSGREISFRCPFCGDSKSDPWATSFYVNIDTESSRLLSYHCFRASCNASGMVDDDLMSMLGLYNREVSIELTKYKSNRVVTANGKIIIRKPKELINLPIKDTKINEKKKDYINKRLGLNLSFNDLYKLKITTSLKDLLVSNNIKIKEDKELYYDNLSSYGISFISAYNDYVIVRDISKSGKLKKRYTNINVFDNYNDATKIYTIPTLIGTDTSGLNGLMSHEPIVINVSEGVFDILGIYYNLDIDRKYSNHIFTAACGGGIVKTIKHFIQQYGLINCKINIFSDSDVKIEKYSELESFKKYLVKPDITVYYNTLEKDFGVTKDKISYVKTKI